ncbi:WD40-repeat-containing domain protein [Daedaleopsis nitida]|nr:WD40-repeat-containing domain protein [Daedaleopsis nitida]
MRSTPIVRSTLTRRVPVEIAEQIIDELWDDHFSLSVCSLTCHAWLPRSRSHLFGEIRISDLRSLDALCHLLHDNLATFGGYVERVTVTCSPSGYTKDASTNVSYRASVALPPILPALRSWTFEGVSRSFCENLQIASARDSDFAAVKSLWLANFMLRHAADFVKILLTMPYLQSLEVCDIYLVEGGEDWASSLARLSDQNSVSSLLLTQTRRNSIASLMRPILEAISPSLEHLIIHVDYLGVADGIPSLSLKQFTRLRSAKIMARCERTRMHCLAPVNHIFKTGLPPKIERLRVDLTRCELYFTSLYIEHSTMASAEWSAFNRLLCDTRRSHPNFKGVEFILPCAKQSVIDRWTSGIANRLPDSPAREMYTINAILDARQWDYEHQNDPLTLLAASPTGKWVVSGSSYISKIWDTDVEGTCGVEYLRRYDMIAASSSSSRLLAIGHTRDATGLIFNANLALSYEFWNGDVWACIAHSYFPMSEPGCPIVALAVFSTLSKLVATEGPTGRMHIFDISTRTWSLGPAWPSISPLRPLSLRTGCLAVSKNEHWLADWHQPGAMLVWDFTGPTDIPSLRFAFTIPEHHGAPVPNGDPEEFIAAAFDAESATLAGVTDRGMVWSWDVRSMHTGAPARDPLALDGFDVLPPRLRRVALSRHATHVAWRSSSEDRQPGSARDDLHASRRDQVALVDLAAPSVTSVLRGHAGEVCALAFSVDGTHLATGSADQTVRLWRTSDAACVASLAEHEAAVDHVLFSDDGRLLVSGARDGTVCVRKMRDLLPRKHA